MVRLETTDEDSVTTLLRRGYDGIYCGAVRSRWYVFKTAAGSLLWCIAFETERVAMLYVADERTVMAASRLSEKVMDINRNSERLNSGARAS